MAEKFLETAWQPLLPDRRVHLHGGSALGWGSGAGGWAGLVTDTGPGWAARRTVAIPSHKSMKRSIAVVVVRAAL
jgi:hypothetical protein